MQTLKKHIKEPSLLNISLYLDNFSTSEEIKAALKACCWNKWTAVSNLMFMNIPVIW